MVSASILPKLGQPTPHSQAPPINCWGFQQKRMRTQRLRTARASLNAFQAGVDPFGNMRWQWDVAKSNDSQKRQSSLEHSQSKIWSFKAWMNASFWTILKDNLGTSWDHFPLEPLVTSLMICEKHWKTFVCWSSKGIQRMWSPQQKSWLAESRAYWNPRSAGHPRIPHTAGKEKWPAELQLHRCTMVH